MRILLTNDDGIYAPGIAALKSFAGALGEVTVVAPDSERSAAGHSITLNRPLRVREVYIGDSFLGYSVDGSPADCVKIGVQQVMSEPPDLVISGINPGTNVGINVLYSGTVAAALEGAILGITSFAVSLSSEKKPDFDVVAGLAVDVIEQILDRKPPRGSLFNVNVPTYNLDQIAGICVARQSTLSYENGFDMRTDPRGGRYYWMTGEIASGNLPADSDMALLEAGYVTVTPLQFDLTDHARLKEAADWDLTIRRGNDPSRGFAP